MVQPSEPLVCVVLIKRNDAGQIQHVVANYRPRTTVVYFARLLAEKFAGTPIAEHFGASSHLAHKAMAKSPLP